MFYNVLRGVALFFNNSSFYDLLIIGVTVGTVFAMIASMLGKNTPIEVLRHVLVGAILFYILVIPRTTVTVIDKSFLTQTSAPMTLSDIPTSLAFLAHTTSKFAVWIDEVYTTYFTSPAELVEAGSHMTRKIMLETALATPESAIFQHNMTEYTRECVVYDLNSGYKTMDSIRNASDTWQALGDTNPAVLVTLMKETMPGSSTYTNQVMSCPEAFTLLTDAKDELASELETRLSKKTFPGMNEVAAKLAYSGVVTSSMPAFMMDTTRTMSEHFQNSVTQNVFMKSLGEISGEPTSMARAMIGVDAGSDQKAELAKSFTYFLTIVQLLVYAFFPIAVMMVIFSGANGLKPLLMIVKVMVWIALVPATQIVLDEMILQNAINEASVVVDGYGAASINAWLQTGGIINGMEDQLQNALFASLALSWGMVSLVGFSGSAIASALFSGAQTYNERTATDLAAEGKNAFGDTRWNNANFDNVGAGRYEAAPTIDTSSGKVMNSDGTQSKFFTGGSTAVDMSPGKNTGGYLEGKVSSGLSQRYSEQAAEANKRANTYQTEAATEEKKALQTVASNVQASEIGDAFKTGKATGDQTATQQAFSNAQEIAKKISSTYNLDQDRVFREMLGGNAGASIDTKGSALGYLLNKVGGVSINAGAKGGFENSENKSIKQGISEALDEFYKNDYKDTQTFLKDARDSKEIQKVIGVSDKEQEEIKASNDKSSTLREKESAERQNSEEYKKQSERIQQLSEEYGGDLVSALPASDYKTMNQMWENGQYEAAYDYMDKALERQGWKENRFSPPPTVVNVDVSQQGHKADAANVKDKAQTNNKGVTPDSVPKAELPTTVEIEKAREKVNDGEETVVKEQGEIKEQAHDMARANESAVNTSPKPPVSPKQEANESLEPVSNWHDANWTKPGTFGTVGSKPEASSASSRPQTRPQDIPVPEANPGPQK